MADPRPVTVVARRIRQANYRYLGFLIVQDAAGVQYTLPMTGTVAQWLLEGQELRLSTTRTEAIGFDDYTLAGEVPIWPLFARAYTLERRSPLSGKVLYTYTLLAREARYERDYEAIVELEQYHYASDEELIALWTCETCDLYSEANARPTCPRCGGRMRLHDLRSATRASRFLVLELQTRAPYEPQYVGYVRVDPPVPLMHRRRPDGTVEPNIRQKVFPPDWFAYPFHPEGVQAPSWWEAQEESLRTTRSPVSRLARVVIHPDYRADGLGQQAVRAMLDWVRERWIPEMRVAKEAIETIATMARYNPFLEKVGFVYLWDTAGGRPVLYYPLSATAERRIAHFLRHDPVAREHGGKLYRSRFPTVEKLAGPLILRRLTKSYTNRLTLEHLSPAVQQLLEAFGVKHRVIQKFIFREAEIEIVPGGVHVLLGASGAGKTTLLRLLYGVTVGVDHPLYQPESAEVTVPENVRVAALIAGEVEPEFGDLPLAEALYQLTGDEGLAVEVLNETGLADAVLYRAPFRELSTGQKERARLAALLARQPNLLLVDEFAAHLDPLTAVRLARRLAHLARSKNLTLVLVTHRTEVIEALEPDLLYLMGYGTLYRATEIPERAFRVMEPYARYIVEGKKRWELRRYPTRIRGRVGVVSGGKLLGTVEILDSKGPFSLEELAEHQEKHLADPRFLREYAAGRPLYAWELGQARKFDRPIPIVARPGQQAWLKPAPQPEKEDAAT